MRLVILMTVMVSGVACADPVPAMRLLRSHCLGCHSESKHKGGLVLGSREAMLKGGSSGLVVKEGKPEESPLVGLLAAGADPHMPPKRQLTAEEVGVLSEWVRGGAEWDAAALAPDAATVRPVTLGALPAGYRPVMALAVSPDGMRLAAGCGNEVLVFAVADGGLELRARAVAQMDAVQSVAWLGDGRLVSGAFRRVVVWGAEGLVKEREVTEGLTDRVTALVPLMEGGKVLVADGLAGEAGMVRVMEVETGGLERSWKAHDDTVFAMALTGDGKTVVTAGGDKFVKFWEVGSGKETMRVEAHGTQVLGMALNGDGTQLVTGGADRQLKVWDVKTRESTVTLSGKPAAFNAVVWGGAAVYAATDDGALMRYDDLKAHTGAQSSETGNEKALGRSGTALYCVAARADGTRVFAGSAEGRIVGWDRDGKQVDDVDVAVVKVAGGP
jgi:WD40 repeat protein